jgi:hypothetical protein
MGREKRYSLDGDVPLWKIPAGVCDACGRYSWMMHLTGAPCARCGRGVYIHRGEFEWAWCHCGWRDPFCKTCQGKGVVPKLTRRERD